MPLVVPAPEHLDDYAAALRAGWSPDNVRLEATAREELRKIGDDPAAFLASLDHRDPGASTVTLPDGSTVPRLPGFRRWIWADDGFCGSIGLRWQPGTSELPPWCLGHVGYAVVPWKRGRGHATRALAAMLGEARAVGLAFVELTTDPDNPASQRVILANGGRLVERFRKTAHYGGAESLRFRIDLPAA